MPMSSKRFAILAFGLCFGCAAIAQRAPRTAATAPSGPAWSPSQSIGLFAFPKNNQTADQQLKDEADCYGMAKQRTGIDAQARPPQGLSEEEKKPPSSKPLRTLRKNRERVFAGLRVAQRGVQPSALSRVTLAREPAPERSPAPCKAAWPSGKPMPSPSSRQPHRRRQRKRSPRSKCCFSIRRGWTPSSGHS
jgi:hypothetical protein